MLGVSMWRDLLFEHSPGAAERLLRLRRKGPVPANLTAGLLENSPVLAAFHTHGTLQRGLWSRYLPLFDDARGSGGTLAAPHSTAPACEQQPRHVGRSHVPLVVEWDVYALRSTFDGAACPPSDPAALLRDTVVQHGTLAQVVMERAFGWEAHRSVQAMSHDMSVPRWLTAYFTALREACRAGDSSTALEAAAAADAPGVAAASTECTNAFASASPPASAPLLSVFLDIKSTRLSAAGVASLVRSLNEAGVHVWGAGSFVLPQLAAVAAVQQSVVCPVRHIAPTGAGAADAAQVAAVCDEALDWLQSRFPAEIASTSTAEASPPPAAATMLTASAAATASSPPRMPCPPPLPLYLFATAAQLQRSLTQFPAAAADASPVDLRAVPVGGSVLFNGGSLLRRAVPSAFAAAFYDDSPDGHADHLPLAAALQACGVAADAAAAVAARVEAAASAAGSDADGAAEPEPASPMPAPAAGAAAMPTADSAAQSSLSWAALAARRAALVHAVHAESALRSAVLPQLYDVDALDLLRSEAAPPCAAAYSDFGAGGAGTGSGTCSGGGIGSGRGSGSGSGGRSLRFGLYTNEQTLEPLAAALLAALAEGERALLPLGFNYGGFHGAVPVQEEQLALWRSECAAEAARLRAAPASSAHALRERPLLNGCLVPWWLTAIGAVPMRVKPRAALPAPSAPSPGPPIIGLASGPTATAVAQLSQVGAGSGPMPATA